MVVSDYLVANIKTKKTKINEHLRDIDQANKEKPLRLYFSSMKHDTMDIEVDILEFIKKTHEVHRI